VSRTFAIAGALATLLLACGARVSIGELGGAGLPTEAEADAAAPVREDGSAAPDAALPAEAGSDAALFDSGPDGGWSPCGGKVCGQACKVCPSAETNCFETAELKACSPTGQCTSAPAVCDGGV
jgi:hypothetical protein